MSVFGALNRFISRLDSDPSAANSRSGHAAFGFQVLRNKNDHVPMEPWYDFIIGINGRKIVSEEALQAGLPRAATDTQTKHQDDPDPHLFATEVRNCAGSNVALTLWSAKGQRVRRLHLPIPAPSPTLGLTLQWTPLASASSVWHILDVIPNSPADLAGLLPYGDYVIGTPEGMLRGESGLGELVEDYLSRPLRLYVYNHEYGVTRLVTITPSRSWGGEGALGCVLGFGALHQLPPALEEPPAAEGDTLFESVRLGTDVATTHAAFASGVPPPRVDPFESPDLLVPASMPMPPPLTSATSPLPARSGRKARAAPAAARGFDDIFAEGEAKSKEEDFAPRAKATPLAPPPPRKGEVSAEPSQSKDTDVEVGDEEAAADQHGREGPVEEVMVSDEI